MEPHALIQDLNRSYSLALRDVAAMDELEALLAERVNTMIQKDFNALVQLLYQVDVSETRLRSLLHENAGENAGKVIAGMILERQWQKIGTRRKYQQDASGDEEKW